jgi:hypothetical protein
MHGPCNESRPRDRKAVLTRALMNVICRGESVEASISTKPEPMIMLVKGGRRPPLKVRVCCRQGVRDGICLVHSSHGPWLLFLLLGPQ